MAKTLSGCASVIWKTLQFTVVSFARSGVEPIALTVRGGTANSWGLHNMHGNVGVVLGLNGEKTFSWHRSGGPQRGLVPRESRRLLVAKPRLLSVGEPLQPRPVVPQQQHGFSVWPAVSRFSSSSE
ncbi:MAG: hypothetical protein DWH80_00650 [Planctomycetota bacterium]|nr:MAG: hypothetical protein DWH80_00650 [Planctomycetota bacterium]